MSNRSGAGGLPHSEPLSSSQFVTSKIRRVWSSDEFLDDDEKVTRSYVLAARVIFIPSAWGAC